MHEHFRRALEDCDVALARKIWEHVFPRMPAPRDDQEALIVLHHARTQAVSVPFKKRAYSHRWLLDSGLPSGLPDDLRPAAERVYPRVAEAVGISVNARSELMRPLVPHVLRAMSDSVLDSYADGVRDPKIIRQRMLDARATALTKLLGVRR